MLLVEAENAVEQQYEYDGKEEYEGVGEDEADLREFVVDAVVAQLQEGEEDSIDHEHGYPFHNYCVFELLLQQVLAEDSRLLEVIDLWHGQQLEDAPKDQYDEERSECEPCVS